MHTVERHVIDERWIKFIKLHQIRLGISLDEPRELHDAHRKTRKGAGTFDQVMRAIQLLKANGVDFHIITLLTAKSLFSADALFEFYVRNGIKDVGFNIEEIEGVNTNSSLSRVGIEDLYKKFLRRFLALVNENPGTVSVREFMGAFGAILDPRNDRAENPQVEPLRIMSVDTEVNVSTFSAELLGVKTECYGDFVFTNPTFPRCPSNSWKSYHRSTTKGTASLPQPSDGLILEIGPRPEGHYPDFPPFRQTSPVVFTWPSIFPAYTGTGLRRRSSIRLRIFRNSSLGTATSANWNVT